MDLVHLFAVKLRKVSSLCYMHEHRSPGRMSMKGSVPTVIYAVTRPAGQSGQLVQYQDVLEIIPVWQGQEEVEA
jgi:hypothetical protein